MFVSSYNTYVHPNSNDRTPKTKQNKTAQTSETFATNFLNAPALPKKLAFKTPINYLQSANAFNNKQKLQQDLALQQGLLNAKRFNSSSAIKNAKSAYAANSTMFSIVPKPKQALTQTAIIKHQQSAINTYLANDKYYQITA